MRRKYGTGSITKKGYIRFGSGEFEHIRVWKKYYGNIPNGMQVHHINKNKQDNRIENLELVDTITHKRLHSGCELRDGEWWKPCRKCGEFKRVETDYYKRQSGISPWCKQCCISNAIENKKRRKLANSK